MIDSFSIFTSMYRASQANINLRDHFNRNSSENILRKLTFGRQGAPADDNIEIKYHETPLFVKRWPEFEVMMVIVSNNQIRI